MIEEFVISSRNREFLPGEKLLAELSAKGFEPQIVGEIDPPPKNGGSWVLRDRRDRRRHEDGGVWFSWSRPRGSEGRSGFPTQYVVEIFEGHSGYDWFLSIALAGLLAQHGRGRISVDGGAEKEYDSFANEMRKDPQTAFHGPESVVDWEAANLEVEPEEGEAPERADEGESDEDDSEPGGEDE